MLSPHSETNDFGEKVQTYSVTYETRARVLDDSGTRTIENGEVFHSYDKTFNVRSYVPITEKDQVEYLGKRYRVLSIEQRQEQDDKLIETELIND